MISNRRSRPLLAIAAVAAVAAMVAGCNSGSGGSQGGYVAPANGGYVNTNPNLPASMSWERTATTPLTTRSTAAMAAVVVVTTPATDHDRRHR
jgi:hypothetical protein